MVVLRDEAMPGYTEKVDIWKIPDVIEAILCVKAANVSKNHYLVSYAQWRCCLVTQAFLLKPHHHRQLQMLRRRCKAVDPAARPPASDVKSLVLLLEHSLLRSRATEWIGSDV